MKENKTDLHAFKFKIINASHNYRNENFTNTPGVTQFRLSDVGPTYQSLISNDAL